MYKIPPKLPNQQCKVCYNSKRSRTENSHSRSKKDSAVQLLFRHSLGFQVHSQKRKEAIFNLLNVQTQVTVLISSTISSTSFLWFVKILVFLSFQINQSVACQINQNPFLSLFEFASPFQHSNQGLFYRSQPPLHQVIQGPKTQTPP